MADSVSPTTKEYENFSRLHFLIREVGEEVLRNYLCSKIPENKLEETLKNNKKRIKDNKNFTWQQKQKLFPQGQGQVALKTFDTGLMALLLRYLPEFKMNHLAGCWQSQTIDDKWSSPESHVMRIKILRNKFSHGDVFISDSDFQTNWAIAEKAILALGEKLDPELKNKIAVIKTRRLEDSEQLKSLLSNTKNFFDRHSGEHVVKTMNLQKAKDILKEHRMIVITGQPGEGKTTMAVSLAREKFKDGRCLNILSCRDWRAIDLEERRIDAVVIDDIFGSSAIKEELVRDWVPILEEMERAVENKQISIIITTRSYILKNMKDIEARKPIVGNENVIISLASKDLTTKEKEEMLRKHADLKGRSISDNDIQRCVNESSFYVTDNVEGFHFGFPECVDMFVKNDSLANKGYHFFQKPNEFFKKCLNDLFTSEDEEKRQNFLALVTVWANGGKITQDELDRTSNEESEIVKTVSQKFGFEFQPSIKNRLQKALKQHKDGFLLYSEEKEEYRFRHNVIGDMVGLVISTEYPKQTLEFCGRDFLLDFVTTDETKPKEYCVLIKEKGYPLLAGKCTKLLLGHGSKSVKEIPDFSGLAESGSRPNIIITKEDLDVGILRHDAFRNRTFVNMFIDHTEKNNLKEEVFNTPIMSMYGFLYNYGIIINEGKQMCLSAYTIFIGAKEIFEEVLRRSIINIDLQFSLMLAVHSSRYDIIRSLLTAGVRPDGNSLYMAIYRKDSTMLSTLLDAKGVDVNDKGSIQNGNNPIIVAAGKGFTVGLQSLIDKGADLSVKNDQGMTALYKSIVYKAVPSCKLLIENGAPLDVRHGKFKRTPLHVAADIGLVEVVELLLKHGASVKKRDHKNHYAIHLAAMQGHVDVVKSLLIHDKSQASLRITSHHEQTSVKGMTVVHIAVWKKNLPLLEALIDLGINPNFPDWFGQTPFYKAVQSKDTQLAEKLLSYPETDVDFRDKNGFTPLHVAVYNNDVTLVQRICERGNVNKMENYGKTPLHLACQKKNPLVVELLLKHGADTRMITKRGDSVLHITRRLLTQKDNTLNTQERTDVQKIEKLIFDRDPIILEFLKGKKNRQDQVVSGKHVIPAISLLELLFGIDLGSYDSNTSGNSDDDNFAD